MNKYLSRFIMISELGEMELKEFHSNERRYSNIDNWYAVSQGNLWRRYPKGFYSEKTKDSVKKEYSNKFYEESRKLFWKENIFKKHEHLYEMKNKKTGKTLIDIKTGKSLIDKPTLFNTEFEGCDWDIDIVQRCDDLIVGHGIKINRDFESGIKSISNNF